MMLYIYDFSIVSQLAPTGSPSLVNSMKVIQNPVKTCDKVYALIQSLTSQIRKRLEDPKSAGNANLPYLFRCAEGKTFSLPVYHRHNAVFSHRPAAVPQRDVGADAAALVQAGERLLHEERPL